ncbi:MAG: hypothetical protein FK733_08800 [Asgard group archaeon]|nr:hypothetical protein [Asgard group archaeon]
MKKGPFIASIILVVIGIIFVIVGAILYVPTEWSDYILWSGLIVFNIGLIVLVTSFIKKPSDETEEKATNT